MIKLSLNIYFNSSTIGGFIQEPELSLKRIAASALSDICKHSPELAQTVVDAGAIAHLAQMILNPDAKLKVCSFQKLK